MKAGDIFYSVMQKDNCPFEQPRISKFKVEKIDNDYPYSIVSTKQDRWGRYYRFKESQIHLTYEDALVEKKEIIEKIEKWEKERKEKERLYFEEQEMKRKQRQLEHDNQIRAEERKKVCEEIKLAIKKFLVYPDNRVDCFFDNGYPYEDTICDIIDKVERRINDKARTKRKGN